MGGVSPGGGNVHELGEGAEDHDEGGHGGREELLVGRNIDLEGVGRRYRTSRARYG